MFKFLKEKLKASINKISKKVEEEAKEEIIEEEPKVEVKKPKKEKKKAEKPKEEPKIEEVPKEEPETEEKEEPKKEGFFKKLFHKKEEEIPKQKVEEVIKESKIEPEKKGIFKKLQEKVTTKRINESQFNELFWDLEVVLLENNVAVEVIDKIKQDLKTDLVDVPIKKSEIEEKITSSLKESIQDLFKEGKFNLIQKIKDKKEKPFVIVFVGINGSGKTTTIAKVAHLLKKNNLTCVLAAADTWRSAAIEQLEQHGKKLDIKVIKHEYGSDPAAVAFDAIKHAKAKSIDVVLIDTAGRQHSNVNLLAEMEKIIRISKPDLKIFIGESITGNDCVEQSKKFNETISLDAVILSKADIDEKGGAAISVSYIIGKPIIYLGCGQEYDDLEEFDSEKIIKGLGL